MVTRYLMAYASRYPLHVREDAIADGLASLLRSADAYDPTRRMSFVSYAIRRAVGAMIDGLRAGDHLTRHDRQAYTREADQAIADGRELPSDGAPWSLDFQLGKDGLTVAEILAADDAELIDQLIIQERDDMLEAEIQRLPEREAFIIRLSYFDGISLTEIGTALGITESRVSQLRKAGLERMRRRLAHRGIAA
jgi:RNA polymerase sigma factor FliA